MDSSPVRVGDVKKLRLEVDGTNITKALSEATIYQNVLNPTWSCHITLDDTTNLLNRVPITPGSKVELTVETDNDSQFDDLKTFDFFVFRIGDKVLKNRNHQGYTLFCVPKDYLLSQGTKVSKVYNSISATKLVTRVISEYLGSEVDSIDDEGSIDFIVPNWSPFKTALWGTKVAIKSNTADYLFFQSDNKRYVMKPLETLYSSTSESVQTTFTMHPANLPDVDYTVNIIGYGAEHHNAVSNISTGYYANKKTSYDVVNKKWEEKIFSYGDDIVIDKTLKSWKNNFFENLYDGSISFTPKHPRISKNSSYLDTQDIWNTSRRSSIQKLNQEKLKVQLPGAVGFYKFIGKNLKVELPSQQDIDLGKNLDEYRKGKYFVSSITHLIRPDKYLTNFELIKKRMEAPIK